MENSEKESSMAISKKKKIYIYIYISSILYILQVVIDDINVNMLQGLVRRGNNWVVHGQKRGSLHLSLSWLLLNSSCLCLSQINIFSFSIFQIQRWNLYLQKKKKKKKVYFFFFFLGKKRSISTLQKQRHSSLTICVS